MFSLMQAMAILNRHQGLIQWGNTRLPEAEQLMSEIAAFYAKHKKTIDGLAPALKEANDIYKKHETGLKEAGKAIPEFQQMVDELLPLLSKAQQEAKQFASTQSQENQNA